MVTLGETPADVARPGLEEILEGCLGCKWTAHVLSQVRAGDHIVAARALFGGCRYVVEDLMPRFGVPSTLVDGRDPENWLAYGRALARADRPADALDAFETALQRGAADAAAVRKDALAQVELSGAGL